MNLYQYYKINVHLSSQLMISKRTLNHRRNLILMKVSTPIAAATYFVLEVNAKYPIFPQGGN